MSPTGISNWCNKSEIFQAGERFMTEFDSLQDENCALQDYVFTYIYKFVNVNK